MPIIINTRTSETEKCPGCNKQEDIKEVCRHCGYEYPKDEDSVGEILFFILILALIIYFIVTIIFWLTDLDNSLLDVLKSQVEWFRNVRIW